MHDILMKSYDGCTKSKRSLWGRTNPFKILRYTYRIWNSVIFGTVMPILTRKLLLHYCLVRFFGCILFLLEECHIGVSGARVYFSLHLKHGYLHIPFPFYLLFFRKYYGILSGFLLHSYEFIVVLFKSREPILLRYFIALWVGVD